MKQTAIRRAIVLIVAFILLVSTVLFAACTPQEDAPPTVTVTSIAVTTQPDKTTYSIGETFSAEGGVLTVTYSDDKTQTLELTDESVELSSPVMTTPGTKEITVTYQGASTTFTITVSEQPVESIEIVSSPAKTEYITGQTFSADGGVIRVTYTDGATRDISLTAEGVTLSEPDMSAEGDQTVTVTYGGKSATFTINIMNVGEQKQVGRITLTTNPTKLSYIAGDAFDPAGGVLTVMYTDRTTEEVPLTDRRVSFGEIDMGTEDMTDSVQRTVTIYFGNRSTTVTIGISAIGGRVTFDMNCDDVDDLVVKVAKGSYATEPETPIRDGYEFYKWYEDAACTVEYQFTTDNVIDRDVTIYAQWKEEGATYHDVTFDYNYYGVKRNTFSQIVKDGENVRMIADPAREEFSFDGWFTDSALTAVLDEDAAVTSDLTIRAKWTKTKVGSSQYIFEAEETDLTGKSGPGYSGEQNDAGMIVQKPDLDASGGAAVSYLYKQGNSLEFRIASSEATTATLVIRIAAELDNVNLTQDNYKIYVNGESQAWARDLPNGGKFEDVIIGTVRLKEGENLIQLYTDNNVNPMGQGNGTYAGTAPMVDCIKLETTAVLMWDGNYDLPMNY